MNILSYVALTVGWLRGGHPERFGVVVMLFYALVEISYRDWRVGDDVVGQARLSLWPGSRRSGGSC